MTDDLHIDGQNEEVEFEREDLGAKPILIFLLRAGHRSACWWRSF